MAYKLSERARTGLKQIKSNPQTASRLVIAARAKSAEKQFMDGYNASKARAAEEAAMRAERIRSNRDALQKAFSQSKTGGTNTRGTTSQNIRRKNLK